MSGRSAGRGRHRGHGGGAGGGGGHGGGDSRWLVTYADLLTLLMVLFLVLWVISTIDLKKFEEFKQGLGAFGNPASEHTVASPGGDEPPATGELAGPGTADPEITPGAEAMAVGATATETTTTTTTTTVTSSTVDESTTVAPTTAADGSPHELEPSEVQATVDQVQSAIAAAGLPDVVDVSVSERGIVVRIAADDVLFESGSADVTPSGTEIIGVVAPLLEGFTNHIMIEGHTDHRPLRRAGYDNWDLSVDRAVSVLHLLGDRFGIAPDRLGAAGYGDQRPVAEGDDPASLAKNRRVEIVVLAGPGD